LAPCGLHNVTLFGSFLPYLQRVNFSSQLRFEVKLTLKMAANDPLPDTTAQKEGFQPPPKFDAEGEAESGVSTEDFSDITLEGKTEDVCVDCEKAHLPQRIVICHDGTWMLPDGAIGK
jgi:hypothetical protein